MFLGHKALARYRISNIQLPPVNLNEQERLPLAIDLRTGLPLRLALRWVMRDRRNSASEKTIRDDVSAVCLFYAFGEDKLNINIDEAFVDGGRLTPSQVEDLITYLRDGTSGGNGIRSLARTAQIIPAIERFIKWISKPLDRGGKNFVDANELLLYHEQLRYSFADIRAFRSRGKRIEPLSNENDAALEVLIGPCRSADGKIKTPLTFTKTNPWKKITRLRNWISYRLGREIGLRRGEIGKVRIDDVKIINGAGVIEVRRRPNDAADTRKSSNRPMVKTVERRLPISKALTIGISQYMHTKLCDGGRRGANTPYLYDLSSWNSL